MLKGGIYNSPPSIKDHDDYLLSHRDEDVLSVVIENRQDNQLQYINKMIKLSRAFSIHYYRKARFWKHMYWFLSAASLGLTGLHTLLSAFLNVCSEDRTIANVNLAIGSTVMSIISGITVLNAPLRRKTNEEAGDKYNTAANNLFVEVFCSDSPPEIRDLKAIIDKYVLHFDELSDRYEEPSPGIINDIMGCEDYEFLIKIKGV